MLLRCQTIWALLYFTAPLVQGFSFTTGNPTSCDNLSISWSGGQSPFELVLIPIFGTPRNVTIPSSAFNNGQGSYEVQVPFSSTHQMLVTMSDASGFGTGGVSNLLTVGTSTGGTCNTTDPGVAFDFETDTALQQCRPYTFSAYSGAVQPVSIAGFVPGGSVFLIEPPAGPTSYDWTANIAEGTTVVFMMTDSQGRPGGSTGVDTVGISDDNSCVNTSSPSSTASPSSTVSPSATSSPSAIPKGSGVSVGAIAGAVLGCLILVAALVTLGMFYLRRRKHNTWSDQPNYRAHSQTNSQSGLPGAHARRSNIYPYSEPSTSGYGAGSATQFLAPGQYEADPFTVPPPAESHYSSYSQQTPAEPLTSGLTEQSTSHSSMTAAQRKAAMAGVSSYTPSRFVLHTDVEEVLAPSGEEVIELPPQYSERRAPLPHLQPQAAFEHPPEGETSLPYLN